MYRSFLRNPFALGLLIIFSSVSVLGHGLHLLSGHDHGLRCGGHGIHEPASHACHGSAGNDTAGDERTVVAGAAASIAAHEHCFICDCLTQAQSSDSAVAWDFWQPKVGQFAVADFQAPFMRTPLRLSARAPPAFGTIG